MDSSNSGSFQSSSGGAVAGAADTEEYDSRTQSISSFLNPTSSFNNHNQLNHLLQHPPPSHHHHQLQSPPPPTDTTTFFNPNPFQDPGSLWTGQVQPNNRSNLTNFNTTTYSVNPNNTNTHSNTHTNMGHVSDHNRNHQMGVTVKNPKKRTRASRRAPTTVLTTDTTNFRQMVQEFTGIPAAPFTTGGPFSRRLDIFRPSPQKLQPQSILPYSSNNNNITTTTATSSSNYNLPPSNIHDQFQKQPSSLLDLQNNNPMLSFQSLLQTTLPQHQQQQQQSNDLRGFSKRWRGQDEKMESFEGVIGNNQNIGVAKLNSGLENVVVSSSDQVQGNDQGSWICPSS